MSAPDSSVSATAGVAATPAAGAGLSMPNQPLNMDQPMRDPSNPRVYFDVAIGGESAGRVVMELYSKDGQTTTQQYPSVRGARHDVVGAVVLALMV
jgi:hypothetical protein